MNIIKRISGTLGLPLIIFLVMQVLCVTNGVTYFGTWLMWKTLIVDIAVSVTCAFGIGLQFKNGRFDFSGGAIMLIAAIVAGNIARGHNNNMVMMVVLVMGLCIVLSVMVALMYVFGRIPIIIATIAMALLYEAVSCLIFGGTGVSMVSNMTLRKYSTYPHVLLPFVLAVLVYAFYSHFTVTGKQGTLLANNQQAAVNIGIRENQNVIVSYLYSGVLFGLATLIWIGKSNHEAAFTSLTTVGELFNNILPVFLGLVIAKYCGDTLGIIMSSVALCLLSYALKAVYTNEMGTAITTVITGAFILIQNVVSAQGMNILRWFMNLFEKKEDGV